MNIIKLIILSIRASINISTSSSRFKTCNLSSIKNGENDKEISVEKDDDIFVQKIK